MLTGQEDRRPVERGAAASVVIRDYRPGDEVELNALFNQVFGRSRTLDEWRWKFEEGARLSGRPVPVMVAEAEGRIIGQWARLILPFQVRDTVVPAEQVVDNLVHPEYRAGSQVQRVLIASQAEGARKAGIAFAFGFPDETAYLLGKMMFRYQDVAFAPTLSRPLVSPVALRRRFPRLPKRVALLGSRVAPLLYRAAQGCIRRRGVVVREVPAFPERVNTLWEQARSGYGVMAVRDHRFLTWRYDRKPSGSYTRLIAERDGAVVGYAVLALMEEGGLRLAVIVDCLALAERDGESGLVRAALAWGVQQRADLMLCRLLREDRLAALLMAHGFREDPDFPAVPLVCHAYTDQPAVAALTDPNHWHVTFGDSDDA